MWVTAKRTDQECYELAVSRLRLHGDVRLAAQAEELLNQAFDKT
ncbi:hypothetical protein [Alloactinosynnema sp. L-07]|nr:hypothetical protein [Alloactinosynnema sp. L-07]